MDNITLGPRRETQEEFDKRVKDTCDRIIDSLESSKPYDKENQKLVDFFYILLRDHMLPGDIETIMQTNVEKNQHLKRLYSNRFLEDYARDLVKRLRS